MAETRVRLAGRQSRRRVTLRHVHSDRVLEAGRLPDREAEGDGLVTNQIGLSIGIRTADCVPLLILDSTTRAVAAVHAGWRGTASGIARRAVERLQASYDSLPGELYAAIGPCIRACCYQVGEEVAARFAGAGDVLQPDGPGKYRLDLAAANRLQLEESGLKPDHVFDCQLCTCCLADRFFSYRREPANPGRLLAAICRIA